MTTSSLETDYAGYDFHMSDDWSYERSAHWSQISCIQHNATPITTNNNGANVNNTSNNRRKYFIRKPSVLKRLFQGTREDLKSEQIDHDKQSYIYIMLSSKSCEWQSQWFKRIITTIIIFDLIIFIISTEPNIIEHYEYLFRILEGITSSIFLIEYITRIIVATENEKLSKLGPIMGRLRYMITFSAIIDFLATIPFFLQLATGWNIPHLSYLRVFRVLRILRTDGYVRAFGACYRVIYYNREILSVAFMVCFFLVLVTAVLLYYLRPPPNYNNNYNDEDGDAYTDGTLPAFSSIPATIFLSTLMLTGQDEFIESSQDMPWYTKVALAVTGALSVAMFAIPVSLLTWGFEAEAERCAKKARRTLKREQSTFSSHPPKPNPPPLSIKLSSSSSADEEYQRIIAREHSDTGATDNGDGQHPQQQRTSDESSTSRAKHVLIRTQSSMSTIPKPPQQPPPHPRNIQICTSATDEEYLIEEYHKVIANEKDDKFSGKVDSRIAKVNKLVDTFLRDDEDGLRFQSLSNFLSTQVDSRGTEDVSLLGNETNITNMNHHLSTTELGTRVTNLESSVAIMNTKLDRICQLLESTQKQQQPSEIV